MRQHSRRKSEQSLWRWTSQGQGPTEKKTIKNFFSKKQSLFCFWFFGAFFVKRPLKLIFSTCPANLFFFFLFFLSSRWKWYEVFHLCRTNLTKIHNDRSLGSAGLFRSWSLNPLDEHALGSSGSCQNLNAGDRSLQMVPLRSVATKWGPTMVEREGCDGTIRRELSEARRLGLEGQGFKSHYWQRIFSLGISVSYLYPFHLASIVQLFCVLCSSGQSSPFGHRGWENIATEWLIRLGLAC